MMSTKKLLFTTLSGCLYFLLFFFVICKSANAQELARYPLIPYPTHLEEAKGYFIINSKTRINGDQSRFKNEIEQLQMLVHDIVPKGLPVLDIEKVMDNTINFNLDSSIKAEEGYQLRITKQRIFIDARTTTGIFRAIQTLRQLMPVTTAKKEGNNTIAIPCATIEDAPLYSWRGMHLDVSRHFFSIDYLKKFIDVMALYKMNSFHLHLTDDQGWRIEIKRYPKLTDEGAWRTFNNQDSECMKRAVENPDMAIDPKHIIQRNGKTLYGGFYTQEQIKDLVKYATSKHINIVPEIDMPGHMMAAISSYPFLSCSGQNVWGQTFSTPICPCKDSTFIFAQNIFSEIIDLFPSKYIHLGADEVEKTTWAQSPVCKELMQREGLKDANELQSYFVKKMEAFFQSKGRQLIGWDEILEGGVTSTAVVMYWRSWVPKAPVEAAQHGNHVVMSPGNPLYFDYPPDAHSLDNIYHFSVVPKGLTAEQAKYILGAQANTWSEYIPSENRADYMTMPRMTALAEILWSGTNNYDTYYQRLEQQYSMLDALNVHYRLPDLPNMVGENVFTDSATLSVKSPMKNMVIHYTTDGSLPQSNSTVLPSSFIIKKTTTVKLAAITNSGTRGDIYTLHYTKEQYHEPVMAANAFPGLQCNYYKSFFKNTLSLQGVKADSTFVIDSIYVPASVNAPSFALQYKGYINVPETGIYSFFLTCDDGGVLNIAGRDVVDNDGLHSAIEKSGQIALEKGYQPLQLSFIEGGGGFKLQLLYSKGNEAPKPVPVSWLMH